MSNTDILVEARRKFKMHCKMYNQSYIRMYFVYHEEEQTYTYKLIKLKNEEKLQHKVYYIPFIFETEFIKFKIDIE